MPGAVEALGVDERVALGLDQLGLQAHRGEVVADELGGAAGVGVVVGLGADAGDPEQGLELLLEVAPMGLQVGVHPVDCHRRSPSARRRVRRPEPPTRSGVEHAGPRGRSRPGRDWPTRAQSHHCARARGDRPTPPRSGHARPLRPRMPSADRWDRKTGRSAGIGSRACDRTCSASPRFDAVASPHRPLVRRTCPKFTK